MIGRRVQDLLFARVAALDRSNAKKVALPRATRWGLDPMYQTRDAGKDHLVSKWYQDPVTVEAAHTVEPQPHQTTIPEVKA